MDYKPDELLAVVAELAERYTRKESSSITYEKAEQFMEAVLYCLHQHEMKDMGEENTTLKNKDGNTDIKLLYEAGYQMVLDKTKRAKALYEGMVQEFESYGNMAYYETVIKGLPSFFVHYDPKFRPQNHLLTLDYPVLGSLGQECGIDVIWHYVNCIDMEVMFLRAFPKEYVRKLLDCVYGNYQELFINIPSVVVRNLLGWMMARQRFKPQPLTDSELETVRHRVAAMELCELRDALQNALRDFLNHGFQDSERLYSYLVWDIPDFAVELKNRAEHDCLVL